MKVIAVLCLCFCLLGCGTYMDYCKLHTVDIEQGVAYISKVSTENIIPHKVGDHFGPLKIREIQEDRIIFSNGWILTKETK